MGRKKRPFYHLVVADSRSPRDGRYIERLGTYNPMTKPATIEIDRDKAFDWVMKGAQPTETARAILRFKGVYFRKHLMRGVQKGAMTIEEAMVKYQEWVDKKEARIASRFEQTAADRAAFNARVNGTAPPKKAAPVVAEAAVVEAAAPVAEEAPEAEAPVAEETAAAAEEATPETAAEEATPPAEE